MPEPRATSLSLELLRMPQLASVLRERPLPSDLLDLIRIAARCPEAIKAAAAEAKVSERMLRSAAVLYLQGMLFFPGADCYRNLGVDASASRARMRLHMRWLLQWLHPDHNADPDAVVFAQQVITAWRTINQTARPSAAALSPIRASKAKSSARPRASSRYVRLPWIAIPLQIEEEKKRFPRLVIVFIIAVAAAAAATAAAGIFPSIRPIAWLPALRDSVAWGGAPIKLMSDPDSLASTHDDAGLH
jgi:hypothetical protein